MKKMQVLMLLALMIWVVTDASGNERSRIIISSRTPMIAVGNVAISARAQEQPKSLSQPTRPEAGKPERHPGQHSANFQGGKPRPRPEGAMHPRIYPHRHPGNYAHSMAPGHRPHPHFNRGGCPCDGKHHKACEKKCKCKCKKCKCKKCKQHHKHHAGNRPHTHSHSGPAPRPRA